MYKIPISSDEIRLATPSPRIDTDKRSQSPAWYVWTWLTEAHGNQNINLRKRKIVQ